MTAIVIGKGTLPWLDRAEASCFGEKGSVPFLVEAAGIEPARLVGLLARAARDAIVIRRKPRSRKTGRISVVAACGLNMHWSGAGGAWTFNGHRRRADTLSMLKRIRTWQHRQSRYGTKENHDWHDAELFLTSFWNAGHGIRTSAG
jgi:hypothetical protein